MLALTYRRPLASLVQLLPTASSVNAEGAPQRLPTLSSLAMNGVNSSSSSSMASCGMPKRCRARCRAHSRSALPLATFRAAAGVTAAASLVLLLFVLPNTSHTACATNNSSSHSHFFSDTLRTILRGSSSSISGSTTGSPSSSAGGKDGEGGERRLLKSKKAPSKSKSPSEPKTPPSSKSPKGKTPKKAPPQGPVGASRKPKSVCDVTSGTWVADATLPRYHGNNCPFIPTRLNCDMNGRPDSFYQRVRWQPRTCNIDRFDPVQFLTRMRGKVIAFAGDELSTEAMFASIRCQISQVASTQDWTGMLQLKNATGYKVPAYQFTAILLRAPFLTWALPANPAENGAKARWNVFSDWIVRRFVNLMNRADVALISAGSWFNGPPNTRQFYKDGKFNSNQTTIANYALAVESLEEFFNTPSLFTNWNGALYLLGYMPTHNRAAFSEPFTTCEYFSSPLSAEQEWYAAGSSGDLAWNNAAKSKVDSNIRFLDVFRMSNFRADAHPGLYGFSGTDCNSWCLPGLPDAWVDVFYTQLMRDSFGRL